MRCGPGDFRGPGPLGAQAGAARRQVVEVGRLREGRALVKFSSVRPQSRVVGHLCEVVEGTEQQLELVEADQRRIQRDVGVWPLATTSANPSDLHLRVEAKGLEPSNLLTASQALYQLSYAPEVLFFLVRASSYRATLECIWPINQNATLGLRGATKNGVRNPISSSLVHFSADGAVDVPGG